MPQFRPFLIQSGRSRQSKLRGWSQAIIYISARRFFPLVFGEASHRMANLAGVFISESIDREAVRHTKTTLGSKSGSPSVHCMARIGAMGHVCRRVNIPRCLDTLTTVLQRTDFTTPSNPGVDAAGNCFEADK